MTFAANARTAVLLVATEDDDTDEPDGLVTATLAGGPGYVLATTASATVAVSDNDEPPQLTIVDATAVEGTGMIEFAVRLAAASGHQVSVICRSEDVTARADQDYEPELGTLVLEPGQTSGTISVPILDDTLDEMDETFKMMLSDPVNAELADGEALGTIVDDDESVAEAWLARFGRAAASHVTDAIVGRLTEGSERLSQVTVAGRRLNAAAAPPAPAAAVVSWAEWEPPAGARTMTFRELLEGSSFSAAAVGEDAAGDEGGGHWTVWGRGAGTQLAGTEDGLSVRGQVAGAIVGTDYDWGTIQAGLSVAYHGGGGEVEVRGRGTVAPLTHDVGSWLLSAHPYVNVELSDRVSLWGVLGYGRGMLSVAGGEQDTEAAIAMAMGALGGRGVLVPPTAGSGASLAVTADGLALWIGSQEVETLPAVTADVQRLRLMLEGSVAALRGPAGVLTPTLRMGARYDGGAAETGTGLEVGGGLRYAYPAWGLTAAVSGRVLVVHEERGYEQWGADATVRVAPGQAGRGPSLRVDTAWGDTANTVERVWSQGAGLAAGLAQAGTFVPPRRLDAEVGYGVGTAAGALVTPFVGVSLAAGESPAYRLGGRLRVGQSFTLALQADRSDAGAVPQHTLRVSGTVNW